MLSGSSTSLRGGHSFFEADLLDPSRTIQLSSPNGDSSNGRGNPPLISLPSSKSAVNFDAPWRPLGHLPATLDIFQDGSLYVVDAPGHLPGHINLMARIDSGEAGYKWVYLAGDACHDRRIIRREREIGEWHDAHGHICCIHANREEAEKTIERIRVLERQGVEVILAHDVEWESDPKNRGRYFGPST